MTDIEWADKVWEPVQGCTKVSAGCENCYAERLATGRMKRFYPEGFGKVVMREGKLDQPLHWRKPSRIFVCSRSDLFHEEVPDRFITLVYLTMAQTVERHTFLILTKRPTRALNFYNQMRGPRSLPNVWLGVSVEDQKNADERVPLLLETPAALHFLSLEPLLGPVNILDACCAGLGSDSRRAELEDFCLDLLIIGCESGPHRRETKLEWVYDLVGQARDAGVPVFIKQLNLGGRVERDMSKFPADLQRREMP